MTILKVVGSQDCVQDNNLPLWGPGGSPQPLCNSYNFSKKSYFYDVLHVFRAIRKSLITKIGVWGQIPQPLCNSCNFSEKKAILTPFWMTFLEQLEKAK